MNTKDVDSKIVCSVSCIYAHIVNIRDKAEATVSLLLNSGDLELVSTNLKEISISISGVKKEIDSI